MADIPTRPVVGWTFYKAAGMTIILDLQTVGSEAELRAVMTGQAQPDHLPALLTPGQCLELAEALRRHAEAILQQQTPPPSGRH